jgi:hypothetical protein
VKIVVVVIVVVVVVDVVDVIVAVVVVTVTVTEVLVVPDQTNPENEYDRILSRMLITRGVRYQMKSLNTIIARIQHVEIANTVETDSCGIIQVR